MSILNQVKALVNKGLAPLADKRVATPLTVLLILYSGLLAGTPTPAVRAVLARPVVRVLAVFILSVLMARGDRTLALVSTIAVVITMVAATNMDLLSDVLLALDQAQDFGEDVVDFGEDVVEDVVDIFRGRQAAAPPAKNVKKVVQEIVGA